MTTIKYVRGDATRPQGDGSRIIVHGCNAIGKWGRGFVLALSRRWSKPERSYREWHKKYSPLTLGWIQIVEVENELFVANCVIQETIGPCDGIPRVDYPAVRRAFWSIATNQDLVTPPFSIHMPRLGCGLAGGSWDEVEPLIIQEFCAHDILVYVYDL